MIELFKKYKVTLLICLIIIANIGWYILKDREDRLDSVDLTSQTSSAETWNQQNAKVSEETPSAELTESEGGSTEVNPVKESAAPVQVKVPVYLCGEVQKPGVYYVNSTAIINEVIEMSGGLTQKADKSSLNLAGLIEPNQKIYVPKIGEQIDKYLNSYDNNDMGTSTEASPISTSKGTSAVSRLININTATLEELQTLSGIGEVKAKAIINYRSTIGHFKTIDELLNVSGIGDKTFDKIKPFITI